MNAHDRAAPRAWPRCYGTGRTAYADAACDGEAELMLGSGGSISTDAFRARCGPDALMEARPADRDGAGDTAPSSDGQQDRHDTLAFSGNLSTDGVPHVLSHGYALLWTNVLIVRQGTGRMP